ncbi:MAG: NAD(P)-dependent oxidoreductase [bacterium]
MRVLVTGACGNVGAFTVGLLRERGHEVVAFDVDSKKTRQTAARFAAPGITARFGDIRDASLVRELVGDVGHVLHLAAVLPPVSDENEALAFAVNVGGTRNLVDACRTRVPPPTIVFCSTPAAYGRNRENRGLRRADEPLHPEDTYSRTKVECETLLRDSGLPHVIFRLAAAPPISLASVSPFLFEFHPEVHIEFTHPRDVALALANTVGRSDLDGQVLLIGGGAATRMDYRDFFNAALGVLGIAPLPRAAFGERMFYSDWLESDESEALLRYRQHGFQTYLDELRALVGPARHLIRPFAGLARAYMLAHSRPYAEATGKRAWMRDLHELAARRRRRRSV